MYAELGIIPPKVDRNMDLTVKMFTVQDPSERRGLRKANGTIYYPDARSTLYTFDAKRLNHLDGDRFAQVFGCSTDDVRTLMRTEVWLELVNARARMVVKAENEEKYTKVDLSRQVDYLTHMLLREDSISRSAALAPGGKWYELVQKLRKSIAQDMSLKKRPTGRR